ncbi:acyltransferase family protein [Sphingobacterium arenae]|uniref:acyltransferase family protein n=1 Tax=Sphingobacterium arenae TaxID=1280598 RepID=UPI00363DDC9F
MAFLRAVAILSVVLYHLGIPYFEDGYIGVDIFFVLSGYLMTKIILVRLNQGTFRLVDFYRRRLIRILPALLILIIFFYILLYFVLGIKLYDFSRFALSSSIFVSNIYYELSSGYFQPASQLNFLLHTWSLSIEMQFYVLYPLLLIGFRYLAGRRSPYDPYFIYGLGLLSLCCMLYYAPRDQSFTFYMFHTRAWELLAGGVVFLHEKSCLRVFSQRVRNSIALLCVVVLLVSVTGVLGMRSSGWPSAFALLPVIATGLLIAVQSDLRLFRLPGVKFVADISYSWYLWHWPLIVLGTYFSLSEQWYYLLAVFVLSFILGTWSYYFVEKSPFLRSPKWLSATAILVVVTAFLGTQLPLHKLFANPQEANLVAFHYHYPRERAAAQYGFGGPHLLSRSTFNDYDTTRLFQFSDTQPNYLLLGDCHAGMFAHTLQELAVTNDVNLLQATGDDVFPAPHVKPIFAGPTALMHYLYEHYLPTHHDRIDKVILSANYAGYSKSEVKGYLDSIEAYFTKLDIPVVYIGQTESYTVEYPVVETLRLKFGIEPENYLQTYRTAANDYLKTSKIGHKYIDVYRRPTLKSTDGIESYMYDADHFSTYGTEQYRDILAEKIFLR